MNGLTRILATMIILGFLVFAPPKSLADTVLENGDHAGSIVSEKTTIGWFIDNNHALNYFKDAVDAKLPKLKGSANKNKRPPDYIVFVVAESIMIDGSLSRKHFSFLTEQQIRELETAGLGNSSCNPWAGAMQNLEVVVFVTVELKRMDTAIDRKRKLSECVAKVFSFVNQG